MVRVSMVMVPSVATVFPDSLEMLARGTLMSVIQLTATMDHATIWLGGMSAIALLGGQVRAARVISTSVTLGTPVTGLGHAMIWELLHAQMETRPSLAPVLSASQVLTAQLTLMSARVRLAETTAPVKMISLEFFGVCVLPITQDSLVKHSSFRALQILVLAAALVATPGMAVLSAVARLDSLVTCAQRMTTSATVLCA